MSTSPRFLTRTILVGVLIVSNAYGASALTVQRSNHLVDGVYVPVLVVKHQGVTTIHMIGEGGLTRSILFNSDLALAWAQNLYGAEDTTGTTSEYIEVASDGSDDDDDDGGY
jgi:hypothetical protein